MGMSFKYLIIDFFLLVASFFAVNYFKYETLAIREPYLHLFIFFLCLWLIISLLTKKFRRESFSSGYLVYLFLLIRSAVYLLSGVALMVVLTGETGYSKFFIFGTFGLFVLLEIIVFTAGFIHARGKKWGLPVVRPKDRNISLFLLIGDLLLFIFSFFLVNYFKRHTWALTQEYEIFFFIMLGLWVITAAFTAKFDKRHLQTFFFAVSPYLKSIIFMALIMATLVVGLEMFHYSRAQIFSFLLLFGCLDMVLLLAYYTNRKEIIHDVESTQEIRSIMRQTYLATNADSEEDRRSLLFQPIAARMKDVYLKDRPQVYDFLNKAINFSGISRLETMILDTPEMSNFTLISLSHTRLMINLHRINDIRWINRYFLQAHAMLVDGGVSCRKSRND